MNSRRSGDVFEYHIIMYLELSRVLHLDKNTLQKRNKLLEKYDKNNKTSVKERIKIFKLLNKCLTGEIMKKQNIKYYKLTNEYEGVNGIVADIVLYDQEHNIYPISCKHNNVSIKHQRPSNLDKQLQLDDETSCLFRLEYKKVNDDLYNDIKQYHLFSNVPKEQKNLLYNRVNDLVMKHINFSNEYNVKSLYSFLLSVDETFIVKYDNKVKEITMYDNVNVQKPFNIVAIKNSYNSLLIGFDNGIILILRLHNASSKITTTLSLKYDTTVVNANDIFNTYVFK